MRKSQLLDYNHNVTEVRPVDYRFADTVLWSAPFQNCVFGFYRAYVENTASPYEDAISQFRYYLALFHATIREMNEEERLCTTQNSTTRRPESR